MKSPALVANFALYRSGAFSVNDDGFLRAAFVAVCAPAIETLTRIKATASDVIMKRRVMLCSSFLGVRSTIRFSTVNRFAAPHSRPVPPRLNRVQNFKSGVVLLERSTNLDTSNHGLNLLKN